MTCELCGSHEAGPYEVSGERLHLCDGCGVDVKAKDLLTISPAEQRMAIALYPDMTPRAAMRLYVATKCGGSLAAYRSLKATLDKL